MSEPKFRAHNGTRTSWMPIDIDSGPQSCHIGDAKVLMITEGPESNKTLNLYYETDTETYEDFRKTMTVFYVIGVGEQVPLGCQHAGSVLLRSGSVFHIYQGTEVSNGGVQLQAEG
ncbi:hypothetical protein SEA_ALAINAMARIE_78 [Gordonia phage AlainaMarie]|nr:hypothetical protein SEA_ALAINAMARIE_78 [Gordonia phage AlainaMarie]